MKRRTISLELGFGNCWNDDEDIKSLETLCSEIIPALSLLIKEQQAMIELKQEAGEMQTMIHDIKSGINKLLHSLSLSDKNKNQS